jgi:hypothetical protein
MDMGVWWFEFIVKYLGEAVLAEVVSSVMDVVPAVVAVVNPGAGEAPPGSQNFEKIIGWGAWVAFAIGVLGIIGIGAMMTTEWGRRRASEHVMALIISCAGCGLIAAAGGIVGALSVTGS